MNDVFRAGVEPGGLTMDYEIKVLICYMLAALDRPLPAQGLVEGVHGKGGGYRLTRAPQEYPINEILQLTEGSLAPVACLECGAEACKRAPKCRTLPMWTELDRLINGYLEKITLADLMKK